MAEYEQMVARQRKWMLYLLAILVLGAGFTPYTQVFNGLLLGAVVSFYNLWLLQRKINDFGETVVTTGKARGGLGVFSRLAAVAVAILIALRFPEKFHILAVGVGIISSYFIIIADNIVKTITDKEN